VFNSDPHVLTIPTGLSNFVVEDVFFWGPIMASTVLTVIPPLAVYFFFQRWLITGLTMGAVKA
jgi:ABC-type glycerol-3-phosphate transport system permease component